MTPVRRKSPSERARLIANDQKRLAARAAAQHAALYGVPVVPPAPPPEPENPGPDIAGMVQTIVKCPWTPKILDCIRSGLNRPTAMLRTIEGLTPKMLNDRLDRLCRFNMLGKRTYPDDPPRHDFGFSPFGARMLDILDRVESLRRDSGAGRV